MTEVVEKIDITSILLDLSSSLNLKIGKDFIFFLDSTLLRIWFFTEKAKSKFNAAILTCPELLEKGVFINEDIAEKHSIPMNDRKYGDLAWWANEGTLVFPDFFHNNTPYKGMHGYAPITDSTYGTCFITGENIKPSYEEEIKLNNVFDLLVEMLEVKWLDLV